MVGSLDEPKAAGPLAARWRLRRGEGAGGHHRGAARARTSGEPCQGSVTLARRRHVEGERALRPPKPSSEGDGLRRRGSTASASVLCWHET